MRCGVVPLFARVRSYLPLFCVFLAVGTFVGRSLFLRFRGGFGRSRGFWFQRYGVAVRFAYFG